MRRNYFAALRLNLSSTKRCEEKGDAPMSIPKVIAAVTAASFLMLAPAIAQTNPPVDAQSNSKAESPTTPGAAKAPQAADPYAGQNPAADSQSKKMDNPAVNGAGSGEQGSDSSAGQKPATGNELTK
jgi:hypothetical protein